MPESDSSRPLKDHSSRKTTSHVQGVGRQAAFFAQSSVPSIQPLFFLTPETFNKAKAAGLNIHVDRRT
jgi:hypothetical protein